MGNSDLILKKFIVRGGGELRLLGGEASPAPPPPHSLDETLLVATYMVSCPGNGFWER